MPKLPSAAPVVAVLWAAVVVTVFWAKMGAEMGQPLPMSVLGASPVACVVRGLPVVPPSAVNPLAPKQAFAHAPELLLVAPWRGPWERGYLTDWLGVRTRYALDCTNDYGYFDFVPSRRLPCIEHDARVASATPLLIVDGYMPVVDDEYPEWIDMIDAAMHAAARARACRDGGPSSRCPAHTFVVLELGARYGTWGIRALAFWRALCAPGRARFVGVDGSEAYVINMHQHAEDNGFESDAFVGIHGFCDATFKQQLTPKPPSVPVLGLVETMHLGGVTHIDFLDLDIQGSERDYFQGLRDIMDRSVAHVHVGTHSTAIHEQLKRLFADEWGWEPTQDHVFALRYQACDKTVVDSLQTDLALCSEETPRGPVYVRDGLLGFRNPKF